MVALAAVVLGCRWSGAAHSRGLGGHSLITTLLQRQQPRHIPNIPMNDPGLISLFGDGDATDAGVVVNDETAVKFSAVYACVRIIAETIASLPLKTYEAAGGGRVEAKDHPLTWMLNYGQPNPDMTPMVYREVFASQVLLHGNGYSDINWNGRGEPESFEVRQPSRVFPFRLRNRQLAYKILYEDGGEGVVMAENMLHVPGMGGDGIEGWSPIRLFRESVGLGLAAERMGSRFFGKSARPSIVIEPTMNWRNEADKKNFLRDLQDVMGAKAFSALLLNPGMKATTLSMPMTDAQFIESRKFQIQDIARIYRVPPHMLADLERATFSNIEQQSLDFEKHTIRPWLVRIEQEYNRKLISKRQQGRFYLSHNVEGLLRGDIKSRFEAYQIAFMHGWMNRDEIRSKENMPPTADEAGDKFFVPVNLQPAERALEEPEQVVQNDGEQNGQRSAFLEYITEGVASSLIGREMVQARRAARKPGKFLEWLDEFYADHRDTMTEKFGKQHAEAIAEHCERSKAALLEAAGNATRDELVGAVEAVVASWGTRVEELTDSILQGVSYV